MTSALPIDMVSDVVCPWCFIGKRRLEKAIALAPDIPVEVRFRPYFLNPWVPREGISREEYLTTKFGSPERYRDIAQRVAQAAAAEGLTYALDSIKRQPNTLDCHRLILWAGEIGNAARMKQRLMDLYFTEGGDLTDRDVLVEAAADCGLDADLVRQRLAARRRRRRAWSGKPIPPRRPASTACRASSSAASWPCRRAGARTSGAGDRTRGERIRQAPGRGIADIAQRPASPEDAIAIRTAARARSATPAPGSRLPRSTSPEFAPRCARRPPATRERHGSYRTR